MYPFLSFRSLTTNIVHAVGQLSNVEGSLGDASGLDSRAKDVLIVGNVVGLRNARDRVEITVGKVSWLVDGKGVSRRGSQQGL